MTSDELEKQVTAIRRALALVNEVFGMLDVLTAHRNATDEYQKAATRFRQIQTELAALTAS
jgi:hypothetical protein